MALFRSSAQRGPASEPLPAVPTGWTALSARLRYDVGSWITYGLSFLGDPVIMPRPDKVYAVRCDTHGTVRNVRLSYDHAPDALVKNIEALPCETVCRRGQVSGAST